MTNRQYSDWSTAPASTMHGSHSSIERIVWADDDNDRIDQNKTSSTWCYCFKYCIVGSLIAGIGLAIVLTFWLTSKTAGTKTLIVTTSSSSASSSFFASTSISASSNTPLASTSISTSSNTPSASASASTSASSNTPSASSSISTSPNTPYVSTSISTSTNTPSTTTLPLASSLTTAFNCASTITSTLNSYTNVNCSRDIWHTFSNSFVASYTGIRTLVFSFTQIAHADMYLTNIKVFDATNVQLLNNGDFSASSGSAPTNWLKCADSGQVDSACNVDTSIACYTIQAEGGSISQSFSVVSGTNYTVDFDLYYDSTAGSSDRFTLDVGVV
ncbi:unnamed protein product [Adineta steineri]|uniref:Uncharacterized protein n=1 Tax=Adineta steineri TaxID=433720 RepID=A0A818V836_9BILA|nr:unnamed protein product [Adineta steineri]CAF3702549.1 unnamed protein product [Adineta steineri]